MLNDNAKKWVAALRSGEYKQTKEYLHDPNGYCCLGVACDVASKSGLNLEVILTNEVREEGGIPTEVQVTSYDGNTQMLPYAVMNWLGLRESVGGYRVEGHTNCLTRLNDQEGYTFEEIAKIVESEPEGLFRGKDYLSPGEIQATKA